MRPAFEIGGERVLPGTRELIDLPVARLSNHTPVALPVHVVHGRSDGPVMFVSAAIHGDEVIGVEIIRRLLASKAISALRGTLLCIPIVNAFGFIGQSRYLPDRRDLNRSFPGSPNGSLAGQIADLFMTEIVGRSNLGIDLHSGAINRSNLPQLRGDFSHKSLRECAISFGAPIALQSHTRDGSLRQAASQVGVDVVLYEAGEALRLEETAIRIGLKGVLNVLQFMGMIRRRNLRSRNSGPIFAKSSSWIRAPNAGLFRATRKLGDSVAAGEWLGEVFNPYEGTSSGVKTSTSGVIIGRTNVSVVNRADALFHIARVEHPDDAQDRIEQLTDELEGDPIFDEDEVN